MGRAENTDTNQHAGPESSGTRDSRSPSSMTEGADMHERAKTFSQSARAFQLHLGRYEASFQTLNVLASSSCSPPAQQSTVWHAGAPKVKEVLKKNPAIRAILLECTESIGLQLRTPFQGAVTKEANCMIPMFHVALVCSRARC